MHDIPEPWNLIVSPHAIDRYAERTNGAKNGRHRAANEIRNIIYSGKEMILKNKALEIRQMMDHDFKKARYFKSGAFMAVVEDRIIVTVHLAESNKWVEKNN